MKVLTALFFLTAISSGSALLAAENGSDTAAAKQYEKGWSADSAPAAAGGAFGDWRLFTTPDIAGAAVYAADDSKTLSSPGADIDTDGKAFQLLGKTDNGNAVEAAAYRDFSGDGLAIGQVFSIDLAVNYRNGFKGIDLRSGTETGKNRQNVFTFNIGGDDYVVSNAATGNGSVGSKYDSNTSFHIEITQTTITGGTWKITRGTSTATGTYAGVATGIKLYCGGTDGNKEDALFFNNLSIAR